MLIAVQFVMMEPGFWVGKALWTSMVACAMSLGQLFRLGKHHHLSSGPV
jgi:hypothetical protein